MNCNSIDKLNKNSYVLNKMIKVIILLIKIILSLIKVMKKFKINSNSSNKSKIRLQRNNFFIEH